MATERSVLVRLRLDPKGFIAGARAASAAVNDLRKDIDTTNDRTAWLAQSFLALGPTLTPLGAVGVGALAGLATQMTFTAVAAGTLTLAFNGIGDALKALNDYQIDPTEAHLKALHKAMAFIGPTGRDLVRVLDDMRDGFIGLANLSRDKMFPGVIDGLEELRDLAPQVEQIVAKVSGTLGDLVSDAGEGLAGPRFAEFFDFLEADAAPTLEQMGRTVGNIADGFAAMLVAFAPLSRDFSGGMLEMSRAFADWAHGLRDNESFQDFIDYIRENTPKVLDLIGQLVDTFLAIAEAAGPVGEVMIPLLSTVLGLVEALVSSPLGPIFIAAAAAMSLYGRAVALASITTGGLASNVGKLALGLEKVEGPLTRGTVGIGKYRASLARSAGTVGIFALAMSPLPEKLGLSNTALGAMTGSLAGPWGAAVGAGVGLMLDLSHNADKFKISAQELADTLDQQTGAVTKNTRAWTVNQLLDQGVLQAAKDLGIGLDDVTDAALGNELAIERVNRALVSAKSGFYDSEGRTIVGAEALQEYAENSHLVEDAIGDTNGALAEGRNSLILTGEAMDVTRRKFKKAADEVDYFGEAVERMNTKLDKRGTMRAYQASIDDLARAVRENGKTLDINTAKGRENQAALDAIAQSALDMAENLHGADRQEFLKHAREDFVRSAEKLGKTEKAARDLAKELGLVGLIKAKPEVKLEGTGRAHSEIDKLDDQLRLLDNFVARPRVVLARDTNWNFSEGPGFATGGYTGNVPVNQPAGLVHGREFVFDAKATEGNVAMLSRLHEHLRGYQSGGYVAASAQPSYAAGPAIDYEKLGYTIARNAGQLYGDVIVNGDPTVWRKQMEDDNRARSTGALR